MDYIVFGVGTGSSLLLIGWLLREVGPALRDHRSRAANEVLGAQQLVDQMRWARFCGACGVALALGGALVLIVTLIALLASPSDTGGAWAVLSAFGIAAAAMLAWAWLFVSRFGVAGIYRAQPAAVRSTTAPEPSVVSVSRDHDEEDDDLDDATSVDTTESTLDEPIQEPAPATEPAAVTSIGASAEQAQISDPEVESMPASALSPGEGEEVRAEEGGSAEERKRAEPVEVAVVGAPNNRRIDAGAPPKPIVPPGPGDTPLDPDAGSLAAVQTDQDIREPVVGDADREEVTVQTVVPVSGQGLDPSVPALDPNEYPVESESTTVADAPHNQHDPEDAGEGVEEALEQASGRVEALRRLRLRRLR